MKHILLFTFISVIFSYCKAQTADSLFIFGKKKQLFSELMQEQREYWVYLPEDYYDTKKTYPVIYLLDGEHNFVSAVGIRSFLDRGRRARLPDAIIIGICNTDRTRDLTPTSAISVRGNATMKNSGGGENFVAFLREEFIPYIENTYRAGKKRVLIGHSFGGLLTVYILLHYSNLFTDYLAIDPSLWWDDQKLLKGSGGLLKNLDLTQASLYLAVAGKKHSSEELPGENATDLQPEFRSILKENKQTGLKWAYRDFEDETHGSVFLIGTYYGLKYLFSQ